VSEKTAKRDMRKLVELKMAAKKGVKKGAYFEAA
jgi:Fic family protein